MKRRPSLVADVLLASATLPLTACGSEDEKSNGNDKIIDADAGDSTASASPSKAADVGRPDLSPPRDVEGALKGCYAGGGS